MGGNLITVESRQGALHPVLQRVMRMVPDKDKSDKRLQRLLVFRLQHDGEAATCEYLMRQIRSYIRHSQPMGFFDFLVRHHHPVGCRSPECDPPGAA